MWVIPKRKPRYPKSLEREYARLLARYCDENMKGIRTYTEEMKSLLTAYGVRIDAFDVTGHIEVLIDRLKNSMKSAEQMRSLVEKAFDRVNAFNLQDFDAVIKSVLGAPLREMPFDRIHKDDMESELDALKAIWVEQNLDLIKSIDEETLAKIRRAMQEGIISNAAGARKTSELIEQIKMIAEIEHNRAVLIGSDQVGKLNSRLAQYRQQNAGITHYVWQTAGDRRVRPRHQAFSGRTFSWERGSDEGHPGEPVRCRCVAIPVIDLDRIATEPVRGSYLQLGENGLQMAGKGKGLNVPLPDIENYTVVKDAESVRKAIEFGKLNVCTNINNELGTVKNGEILNEILGYLKERKEATGLMFDGIGFAEWKADAFAEYTPGDKHIRFNANMINSRKALNDSLNRFKQIQLLPKGANLKFCTYHEWAHTAFSRIIDANLEEAVALWEKHSRHLICKNSTVNVHEFISDTVGAFFTPGVRCSYADEVVEWLRSKGGVL